MRSADDAHPSKSRDRVRLASHYGTLLIRAFEYRQQCDRGHVPAALVSLCAHAVSALMRFDLLISKVIATSRFVGRLLPFGDGPATLFLALALFRLSEDYTVFRKISLALVL